MTKKKPVPERQNRRQRRSGTKTGPRPAKAVAKPRRPGFVKPTGGSPRTYLIHGSPSTRVIHWMAINGFTLDEVKKVLNKHNLLDRIKPQNLQYRYNAGKDPRRTRPALLSAAVEAELRKFHKGDR